MLAIEAPHDIDARAIGQADIDNGEPEVGAMAVEPGMGGFERARGFDAQVGKGRCQHVQHPVPGAGLVLDQKAQRSEEHTSELQSLMRISYAVFCLKKKNRTHKMTHKY